MEPLAVLPIQSFKRTSEVTPSEVQWVKSYLKGRDPFNLYFQSALDAWEMESLDNRMFYLAPHKKGLILGIDFDSTTVFTTLGELSSDELSPVLQSPKPTELHIETRSLDWALENTKTRLKTLHRLRYYRLSHFQSVPQDKRCRLLTPSDFDLPFTFFSSYYPETVFSQWMLESPFIGLFEDEKLVATGGTIIWNKELKSANIGNFLTAPQFRNRGYAQSAANELMRVLSEQGIETFTLGTTDTNLSACRAYEAVGFEVIETRLELDLEAIGKC